jgi:hypothetical protein
MADTLIGSIDILDVNSITNIESLFVYGVYNGNPRTIDGGTLSQCIMGGPAQWSVKYRTQSLDPTRGSWVDVPWTNTNTDVGGLVDASSNTLFRIPNDRIAEVQLMFQIPWEGEAWTTQQYQHIRIVAGGLPETDYTTTQEDHHDNDATLPETRQQIMTDPIAVQSGSYFRAQVFHQSFRAQRQVVSQFWSDQANDNFFAIWVTKYA